MLNNLDVIWGIVLPVALHYLLMYAFSVLWSLFLIYRGAMEGEKAVVIIYTSVARHINIYLALVLSTFPLESASLMILVLIVGYIIQVPTLAFFAQHYGKKLASMG
ncbi:MAG: hypothetical protein K9K82_05755 [Desulfobacteraceae bacterium]|nr:hypothetical protein [Desulfobacteraceae bacterium]